MLFRSAAVSAIRHLNRRNQFPSEFKRVLLACEVDPFGLCRWIQSTRRAVPAHSPTSRAVTAYFDDDKFPQGTSRDLLLTNGSRSMPSLTTSDAAEDPQFIVLEPLKGEWTRDKVNSSEPITYLSMGLASLARWTERAARLINAHGYPRRTERGDLPQLQRMGCDIDPSLSECIKLLLPPRSVDLMIVDFPRCDLAFFMQDSLIVSSFFLSPNGSLLLVYPEDSSEHAVSSAANLRRLAKRKFRESYSSHVGGAGGARYFYATSIAGGEGGRAVDRSDFPGFLPKGKKRERQWNPYERHKTDYFEFLGPSFTTARYTREPLQTMLNRQQEEEETLVKEGEELFGVSFEMVEKQTFYSKRDD